MIKRIIVSSVALLAVSAGVAYAATQLASSEPTQVCVNNVTGLMRADDICRQGEHAITVGGGGDVRVTQSGTFAVALGETGTGTALPLTGVTVTGFCRLVTPPPGFGPSYGEARFQLTSANGTTMDAFTPVMTGSAIGVQSVASTMSRGGPDPFQTPAFGWADWIVTSNDATATLKAGGSVDWEAQVCRYVWQAVEAPN